MNTDYEKLNRYRPSPDALLNPCHDEVFKALFTNESEESHTALRCFLTAVLHKEVKDVQLRPNEPPVLDDRDKAVRFDVSCTFNDGEAADVVMFINKQSAGSASLFCKCVLPEISLKKHLHPYKSTRMYFCKAISVCAPAQLGVPQRE
jgi:hypothetical protein